MVFPFLNEIVSSYIADKDNVLDQLNDQKFKAYLLLSWTRILRQ